MKEFYIPNKVKLFHMEQAPSKVKRMEKERKIASVTNHIHNEIKVASTVLECKIIKMLEEKLKDEL